MKTNGGVPARASAALIVDDEPDERARWLSHLNGQAGFAARAFDPKEHFDAAEYSVLCSDVLEGESDDVTAAARRVSKFKSTDPTSLAGFLTYFPERVAMASSPGDFVLSKKETPPDDFAPLLRRVRQLQSSWELLNAPDEWRNSTDEMLSTYALLCERAIQALSADRGSPHLAPFRSELAQFHSELLSGSWVQSNTSLLQRLRMALFDSLDEIAMYRGLKKFKLGDSVIRHDYLYDIRVIDEYVSVESVLDQNKSTLQFERMDILERALPFAREIRFRFAEEITEDELVSDYDMLRVWHAPIVFERSQFKRFAAPDPSTCRAFALHPNGEFRAFGRVENELEDAVVREHDLDAFLELHEADASDILRGAPVSVWVMLLEFHNG